MSVDLPETFTRTQLDEALTVLGLNPRLVESITITPERVAVTIAYAITDAGSGVFPTQRAQVVIPVNVS